jgi:hypothetical protein
MIIKMTIPSVFFSIMAFIIVSTTSFIVIHNKSKVKHIDNKIAETNNKLFESEGKNIKKISNLVNEINLGNQKRDFKQKKEKTEQERINKKHEAKQTNLDKRFNSYKNITTANFMGMNNRITSENKRLKEDIDIVDKKLSRNATSNILRYNDLSSKISANDLKFTNFRKNDYVSDMARLQAQINKNKDDNSDMYRSITRDSNNLSKLTIDTGLLLDTKIDETRTALNNFFKSPDMVQTYSTKTYDNFPDNFESWHDYYYNFGDKNHFKSFNEMINSVDESITKIQSNRLETISNLDKITEINTYLQSNIDKDNYAAYMLDKYKFNPIDLSSIKSNSDSIGVISSNISSLQTTLEQIGINDPLTNDGTISLAQLNESIQSNQDSIIAIDSKTNQFFQTDNFNSYFDSRLSSNNSLNFISSNIDHSTIVSKINNDQNIDLNVKDLSVENVMTVNDIVLNDVPQSMGEFVNSNYPILRGLDDNITRLIPGDLSRDQTIDDLYEFSLDQTNINQQKLMSMRSMSGVDNSTYNDLSDKSEFVRLKPGANFHLSRNTEQIGRNRNNEYEYGGRIYLDSLNDIGVINRNEATYKVEYDDFKRPSFAEFTDMNGSNQPSSIGHKLDDLYSKIGDHESPISVHARIDDLVAASGVSKNAVFTALHPSSSGSAGKLAPNNGAYVKDPWMMGGTGLRIENLYTGAYDTQLHCLTNGNYNTDKNIECQSVDNRLKSLELLGDRNENTIDSQIQSYMSTLSGIGTDGIGSSTDNLEILNPQLTTKTLKPDKLDLTDKTGRNIIPNLDSDDITLNTLDGLKYKKTNNTVASYSSTFLNKSTDQYVSAIANDASGYAFTIENGVNITIPKRSDNDIQSFVKNSTNSTNNYDEYEYTKVNETTGEKIRVPKKYVQTIEHDSAAGTLTINSIDNLTSSTTTTPTTIDTYPGIAKVKTDLGMTNNEIKIGDDCLKLSGAGGAKTLKFCEECDADSCTVLWDHRQAPPPTS